MGNNFNITNILILHFESSMFITQHYFSKVILLVKCVFISVVMLGSFITLAFQRSTWRNADITSVLKQFIVWERKRNNILLPKRDVTRCANKLLWVE